MTSAELRELRDDPFALLAAIESRLQLDRGGDQGRAQHWTGLGFRLGGTWFVAPRDEVREVIAPPPATRVPNAHDWLGGIANVRGELLAIIDLGRYFEQPPPADPRGRRVLVLNSKQLPAGLVVDEIAGYRQFAAAEQRNEMKFDLGMFAPYLLGAFVRDGQPWYAFSLLRLAQSEGFRAAAL